MPECCLSFEPPEKFAETLMTPEKLLILTIVGTGNLSGNGTCHGTVRECGADGLVVQGGTKGAHDCSQIPTAEYALG
jgi:hypothetical protein